MFDKLKRALGFGNIDDDDELLRDDPETMHNAPEWHDRPAALDAAPEVDSEKLATRIFDHVVEQFNAALPDFLKNSVDPEREKRQLYESLSDDLKKQLSSLEAAVTARVDAAWRTEREKLQTDLQAVRKSAKDIENKRNELKSQQLSAERQKRAMTERIHDLEKQMLELSARKEQIELENKSMLNKVKVAGVYEKELDELRKEMIAMQNQSPDEAKQQNAQLQAKITEMEKANKQLKQSEAELKSKTAELEKKLREQASADSETTGEIERLKKIEAEYTTLVAQMEQVEKQLSKIDDVNAGKDRKIAELKKDIGAKTDLLAEKENIIGEKERLIASLRKQLADAEKQQSAPRDNAPSKPEPTKVQESHPKRPERERKEAVNQPKPAPTPQQAPKTTKPERNKQPKPVTLDDDLISDTDWIVKPSPKKSNQNSRGDRNRNVGRAAQNDDGQMSLW